MSGAKRGARETLVERLVRVPSASGDEAAAVGLLVEEMQARGFAASVDEAGNAIGVRGNGSVRVYLVGHIDTVPGQIPVAVRDGALHGRGSVDAKGPLATFVEAAAGANAPGLRLTVVGCVGEEADSPGARHLLRAHAPADYVVIGEPSGWDGITLGYKGSLSLRYRVEKPLAHRGAPSATPAEDAVAFYNALCAACPERGVGFGDLSFKLTSFRTEGDGLRERAALALNVRTPPGFDAEALARRAQSLAGEGALTLGEALPAVLAGKANPLVRALLHGVRAVGGTPRFVRKTGTSDMNLLQAWGCPILAYGPGNSTLDHTPNEHLMLDEYATAIRVLVAALEQLDARG